MNRNALWLAGILSMAPAHILAHEGGEYIGNGTTATQPKSAWLSDERIDAMKAEAQAKVNFLDSLKAMKLEDRAAAMRNFEGQQKEKRQQYYQAEKAEAQKEKEVMKTDWQAHEAEYAKEKEAMKAKWQAEQAERTKNKEAMKAQWQAQQAQRQKENEAARIQWEQQQQQKTSGVK